MTNIIPTDKFEQHTTTSTPTTTLLTPTNITPSICECQWVIGSDKPHYCHCGCGGVISQRYKDGKRKNPLTKYLRGHQGEGNGRYKEDRDLAYGYLHTFARRLKPSIGICDICKKPAQYLELSNISKESNVYERYKQKDPVILATYNTNLDNWFYACLGCHKHKHHKIKTRLGVHKIEQEHRQCHSCKSYETYTIQPTKTSRHKTPVQVWLHLPTDRVNWYCTRCVGKLTRPRSGPFKPRPWRLKVKPNDVRSEAVRV